jgi:GAF domain-containing protein
MADTSIEERPSPCPPAEEERLRALYELDLIGAKRNEQIDRICALTRDLFKVPIALVNLIDRDRVVTVSGFGLDVAEVRREDAICSTTILADTPLVLEDAAADPRFADNVYVRGSPKIRFYAGAPLRLRPGINIGTLCIIDVEPRSFGAAERANLAALADMIVSEIRGRQAALDLSAGQKLLAQTAQMAKIGSWELRPPSG